MLLSYMAMTLSRENSLNSITVLVWNNLAN